MKIVSEYIESGIIESYVFGLATTLEIKEVEQMANTHPEVRAAINECSKTLEEFYFSQGVTPDPVVKPMVLAATDYIGRMAKGESASTLPLLSQHSKVVDFAKWLAREDMQKPALSEDVYAKIIGYTPEVMTAIVWINNMAPWEIHTKEIEKFLIVEGTCDVIIQDEVYHFEPGDFFEIPLFKRHMVRVSSGITCKAILQRVAA